MFGYSGRRQGMQPLTQPPAHGRHQSQNYTHTASRFTAPTNSTSLHTLTSSHQHHYGHEHTDERELYHHEHKHADERELSGELADMPINVIDELLYGAFEPCYNALVRRL